MARIGIQACAGWSTVIVMHPLDNPFWFSLVGPQQAWSQGNDLARRYPPEVAPFAALREPSPEAWAALAGLLEPAEGVALFGPELYQPPGGWTTLTTFPILQLIYGGAALPARSPAAEPVLLRPEDTAAMQALVGLTRPGPFAPRTPELGEYFGVWESGQLIAMAGERARLPGYGEVSAVCVHPQAQGRGLGAAVVGRVVNGILERGEMPFLHVALDNAAARRLYLRLGFEERAQLQGTVVQPG